MSSRLAQRIVAISGIAGLAMSACMIQLPAKPTPAPLIPAAATQAPARAGETRLVVDVVEGPAPVRRVTMHPEPVSDDQGRTSYRFFEAYSPLCESSPCVLDAPPGTNVVLAFPVIGDPAADEVEMVHIGAQPSVYRRSLSEYRHNRGAVHVLGIIATSLGGTAAVTGVTLLPIGLGDDNDGLTKAGGITLAAGAILVALGVWAIRRDSPKYRPGSSLHMPVPLP